MATRNGGTYCKNCRKTWQGDSEAYLVGLASDLVNDWSVDLDARGVIYHNNRRVIEQLADNHNAPSTGAE